MRKLTLLLAAIATAACDGLSADEIRNALPTHEALQIRAPDTAASPSALTGGAGVLRQAATAGDPSKYRRDTRFLAHAVNGSVVWTLATLRAVVRLPPSSCEASSCTWGPSAGAFDANVFKLSVSRIDDGQTRYEYALSAEPKSRPGSGFVTFLSGTAVPSGQPLRGYGSFVADLDAAQALDDPSGETGRLAVTYDNEALPHVAVNFEGFRHETDPSVKVYAAYQYGEDASGGGDLQVAAEDTAARAVTLHSRWTAEGAGRADASVEFPLPGGVYTAEESECWSSGAMGFDVVYWSSNDPLSSPSGDEALCAFAPASFSELQPPAIPAEP